MFAYLDARNEMASLAAKGSAALYTLSTNWRSKPELVDAFNDLFCRDAWFPPQKQARAFEIGYQDAASPAEADLPEALVTDHSRRPALNLVDLRGPRSPRAAKGDLARFIAAEIQYLMTHGGIEAKGKNGDPRPLDFGDICILVRGKSDVSLLEPELIERKIPYTFYKKPGLFMSDEAFHLGLVFHAVADPNAIPDVKKALLTPFFKYEPSDLYDYENLPDSHPLKLLLFQWNEYAGSRKWSLLFQSLMQASGMLFREASSYDWDRRYANYCQIFEHLEAEAYRKNLGFRGLSDLLDSYRKQPAALGGDADIHQIETEDRKVQIMTMHVSKGLQFPVVFIAGGLTQPVGDDYHVYHLYDEEDPSSGVRKIIDLSKVHGEEQHKREKSDEDKRLYYVALTRAQYKLYLPYFPATGRQPWLGPVCRLLSPAIESAFPKSESGQDLAWLTADTHAGGAPDVPDAHEEIEEHERAKDLLPLPLPPAVDFRRRRETMASFSSLHRSILHGQTQSQRAYGFSAARDRDKEDDESFVSLDSGEAVSALEAEEIPGGTQTGSMFHDIIENTDFESVGRNPNSLLQSPGPGDVVLKYMEQYRIDDHWRPRICQVIADLLTTPIPVGADSFKLCQLGREDRIHEVEFYYRLDLPADGSLAVPDCEIQYGKRGFIRGFVDLVFRIRDKYFIADWKSNRILSGYGREAMAENMEEAGYALQYKLYTIALFRWLKQSLGDRFDPGGHFGGIFYFYLRGVGSGAGDGIYFVAPEEVGRLEHLEEEASALMASAIEY